MGSELEVDERLDIRLTKEGDATDEQRIHDCPPGPGVSCVTSSSLSERYMGRSMARVSNREKSVTGKMVDDTEPKRDISAREEM
jgi:hypothetical protein